MDNTKLRPWQGLIGLAVVLLASVFVFAYVQYALGGVGLVLTELFIALVAVAGVFAFRGTWRDLLPLAKPKARYVVGSVVLWLGVFFLVIALANIQLKLFPETANTSQALSDFFSKESFLMAVIITPLLAGVCEELLHRGFMLSSFKSIKSTWLKVLIFGLLFGLFHLDPYRFVPTAILGALFTFIVLRTGNIIIAMAIHFLHDFISIAVGYAQRDIITDDTIAAAQTAVTSQTIVAVLIVAVFPLAIGLALLRKEKTNKTPSERLLER